MKIWHWLIIGTLIVVIGFFIVKKMKISKLVKDFKVRPQDGYGSGKFGSSRDGGKRKHEGVDLLVSENQPIFAPTNLNFVRTSQPYKDDKNLTGGVWKDSDGNELKIFYMKPNTSKKIFNEGEIIGYAQNVSKKYGSSMKNHIHVEYRINNKLQNPEKYV